MNTMRRFLTKRPPSKSRISSAGDIAGCLRQFVYEDTYRPPLPWTLSVPTLLARRLSDCFSINIQKKERTLSTSCLKISER